MAGTDDEDDEFPATQPVMSVLLSGVRAYVEVRSGHDNRSKGVKAHMRSLGATIEDTLNRKVTHVVFNEGLPSTYNKAKKFNCHLVSVLWIEACKEALTKVSEAGYPPIGQQIYENPDSIKNYKKLKSMQPDSDDEAVEKRTKKMLKRIAKYRGKSKAAAVPDTTYDSDEEETKKTHPQPVNKAKKRTKTKNVPKKQALQEITPDVVNKGAMCDAEITETTNAENVEPLPTADASQGSSSLPQNEAAHSERPSAKSKKAQDATSISRSEFIEGLNNICISLSSESELNKNETSPWRRGVGPPPVKIRRKNPPTTKVSPRRSPRNAPASDSSDCFLFPAVPARKSPRQVSGIVKISAKIPAKPAQASSACTSASAVLMRKKMQVPSSPPDSFILLSQEPGDMPSIDELAKLRRGSVTAGDEHITLSQVIRSYNAAAQEHPENQAATPESSKIASQVSDKNSIRESFNGQKVPEDDLYGDVNDDVACDAEVRKCASRCSSEAGSTVSSTSTRVLINGKPPSEVGCASNYLPSSSEVEEQPEIVNPAEEFERDPSPIFLIKKSRFRRPLKKQLNEQITGNSGMPKEILSRSDNSLEGVSSSLEEKRQSLNPIDYINKLLLPKFLPVDKTPGNVDMGKVIVEETPECVPSSNSHIESHVIPPTPAGNPNAAISLNQSLTSSVISWVKKSCRVPLFSSHSKKAEKSVATPTIPKRKSTSPKAKSNELPFSQGSAATIYYSFSKETDDEACSETGNPPADLTSLVKSSQDSSQNSPVKVNQQGPHSLTREKKSKTKNSPDKVNLREQQSTRKSLRKKNISPSAMSQQSENFQCNQNVQDDSCIEPKSKASSASKKTKLQKPRKKVIVTVMKNDEEASCNLNSNLNKQNDMSTPVILIQKAQEAQCSSGYETSTSIGSSAGTEVNKNPLNTISGTSGKRKKITDLLSPIIAVPKKRSDIYENDSSTASPATDSNTDTRFPQRQGTRKRFQSVPDHSSKKKPKFDSSELDSTPGSRKTRASRIDANNRLTESRSDLSADNIKSFGRKSSEVARQRMAVSLTRNYKSNAPKVIVCTFLTASEQNGIEVAGTKLEGWKLAEKVTSRTTHVINSGPKRTLNMLKGMARGCWLVDQKWMLDSAKAGTWLEEEEYELTKFSPAVKHCRMKRQAIGKEYKHNLFARSGAIYVSPQTDGPPAKDIRELLELCGADLKTSIQEAKIVVGGEPSNKGTYKCVQPRWVLDSITRNKVLPINDPDYQRK